MSKRALLTVSLCMIFLTGCATSIKDIGAYKSAPMAEADVMPTPEQLESKRTKVVVFETDDLAVAQRGVNAGAVMSRTIEAKMSEGGVEIIDRNLASKLRDEITLSEAKGSGNYSGPAVASFAIKSFINNVGYSNQFNQASRYCDPKTGKCYVTPANCVHKGTMNGSIRVYEIPSLRLVTTINVSGSESVKTETSYCDRSSDRANELMRKAVEDGVKSSRTELQNQFAPKGYVVEKRVFDGKVIFKVMFGKGQGAKSQDKLNFFTIRKEENAFTKKVDYEEILVVEGTISDQITEGYCWVVADDADKAKRIRLGDYVKVEYKKSFLENVSGVGKMLQ